MSGEAATLRARAEHEAARLPPLLGRAEQLASSVVLGDHGRRRAGLGDDFWQYRPAQPGDTRRQIDYRRSARGDLDYVREREWQIAQSVMLWVDQGASMRFASLNDLPQKSDRARLLAMACAILLVRGGERVGLTNAELPPRRGRGQILRLAGLLSRDHPEDYAAPEHRAMPPGASALFISDLLRPLDEIKLALSKAADRGMRGTMLQVLDPAEENLPYRGRTLFRSMTGELSFESLKAADLRPRYIARIAERKAELAELCSLAGWHFQTHHTDKSAQSALLWLYQSIGGTS